MPLKLCWAAFPGSVLFLVLPCIVQQQPAALGGRSRLGCQVIAAKELDGIRVRIPGATRNFAVDGHVPKPH